jgi:hypothetical protein
LTTFASAELGPEPGWIEADPLSQLPAAENFVKSTRPDRIRLRYYRVPGDTKLYGKVVFGPGAEGPPRHAHGGALMAVLDEVAGGAAWLNGYRVVLANFDCDMLRSVPLDEVMLVSGEIVLVEGRKVRAEAVLTSATGREFVRARGLFIQLTDAQINQFKLPESTKQAPHE